MTENEQSAGEGGGRKQAEFEFAFSGPQHLHTTTLLQVRYQLRPTEENPLRVSSLRAWTMDGLLLSVTVESYGQGYFK